MGLMKEYLMIIEDLVYDAIEAGAKTNEDVLAWVNQYYIVDLDLIKDITDRYAEEWM